ncbi:uncharacterized protein LOC100898251 [Galendromus occidentalis]|uniref:Uncharacterized protein LOC100898251 n=1 Tax=Galendromus occidentalis TaxID=34638 RepID=A0AAJ6QQ29_9ACAR|nr:uncharacterized protein LOC100898251 [Galendromus occidentalis]
MEFIEDSLKIIFWKFMLMSPRLLQVTTSGEKFLHHDSGLGDPKRLIVFATHRNIELLKHCNEWFMDGTFKSCPSIFYQMFTIHVKLMSGKTVPVIYSFLSSKDAATYASLFSVLKEALDGFLPRLIHLDFERAVIAEVSASFPGADIVGCNFHFNQCLWRHIQHEPTLREQYLSNLDCNLNLRMLAALAFVPCKDVRQAFGTLLETEFFRTNMISLSSFVNYFEKTWIGREFGAAVFPLEWWNSYEATRQGIARTNNAVEGWHSAFQRRLGSSNPTFYKLIEQLKLEQGMMEFGVDNTAARGNDTPPKRVYRDRQRRLNELVESYENYDRIEYLTAVAQNIKF